MFCWSGHEVADPVRLVAGNMASHGQVRVRQRLEAHQRLPLLKVESSRSSTA